MSKPALVILAAGIGSRYGGIKQLDTVTPQGNTIIDFSLFDAINAGFSKIVFVIRDKIRKEFKAVFNEKLKGENIEVEYVDQETDSIPKEFLPTTRTKPWGTGHALLMAKDVINENFCVINADDFYGKSAFEKISKYLQNVDVAVNDFAMIGFQLKNTLSENGSVSRGECFIDERGNLEKVIERTKVYRKEEKIVYLDEQNSERIISPDTVVSMNFWGFTPSIFEALEKDFHQFLKTNRENEKSEFFLPQVINDLITENKASVKVLSSDAKWMGITYREDKRIVTEEIKKLQEERIYPKRL